jgi:hypothetical protein
MVFLGGAGLLATFFLQAPDAILKGYTLLSLAVAIFGLGEICNHPKEKTISKVDESAAKTLHQVVRRRNPSSLGNLLLILALLLFFIGLSSLVYR